MANTATKSAQEKTDKAKVQDAPDTTQTRETASDTPQRGNPAQQDGRQAAAMGQERPTTLQSLDQLATLYRVASWQQAALARMQGWESGKHVTAEEYEAALAALTARPQGGR